MTTVELRHIPGFPGYSASADGRIYSERARDTLVEIKHRVMGKGYLYVNVKTGIGRATMKPMQVHRLVLMAFVGPEPFGHADGRHKDGNKMDCSAANLEWGTRMDNIHDAIRHGTHISTRKVRGPYRKAQGDAGLNPSSP